MSHLEYCNIFFCGLVKCNLPHSVPFRLLQQRVSFYHLPMLPFSLYPSVGSLFSSTSKINNVSSHLIASLFLSHPLPPFSPRCQHLLPTGSICKKKKQPPKTQNPTIKFTSLHSPCCQSRLERDPHKYSENHFLILHSFIVNP